MQRDYDLDTSTIPMSQLSSIEFNFCDVSQQEQFSNTVPLTQQIAFIATSEDEARVLNARLNTV